MKLILLTAIILGFHSLSQADELIASVIAKKDNQLVMISEVQQTWELNQVPFNSLKNLRIKGIFRAQQNAILVLDINDTLTSPGADIPKTHVMTAQEKLIAAEIVPEMNAMKVEVSAEGDLVTVTSNPEDATLIGTLSPAKANLQSQLLLLNAAGQVTTVAGVVVGNAVDNEGQVVRLITDLDQKIATLAGSGSEVVITGEKKEFLDSVYELEIRHAQQKPNPEWVPVSDLKISNLSSVVQVEFRQSIADESFSLFKFVSPLVVSRIRENQNPN